MVGSGSCVWPWEEDNRRAVEKRHAYDGGLQGTAASVPFTQTSPTFVFHGFVLSDLPLCSECLEESMLHLMLFKKGGKIAGPWVMRATCWL